MSLFIAVDGPKCVGKTTILQMLNDWLTARGVQALFTKEPTPHFNLQNEEDHEGPRLARLLADDRAIHIEEEVRPALERGRVVVTDRYVLSSVVFRLIDGVRVGMSWDLNKDFPVPDINFVLTAQPGTLAVRRQSRPAPTRLTAAVTPAHELALYTAAMRYMHARRYPIQVIDNTDDGGQADVVEQMGELILTKLGEQAA